MSVNSKSFVQLAELRHSVCQWCLLVQISQLCTQILNVNTTHSTAHYIITLYNYSSLFWPISVWLLRFHKADVLMKAFNAMFVRSME